MNIAFLGTGLMGSAMAERVASSKLKVIKSGTDVGINQIGVYNRSVEKTQKLKELGAAIYTDPVEAIKSSEVVIIMLSEYSAINEVLFKNSYSDFSGKTVIMMSTIASEESCLLDEKIKGSVEIIWKRLFSEALLRQKKVHYLFLWAAIKSLLKNINHC